jgi:hypothetical protein
MAGRQCRHGTFCREFVTANLLCPPQAGQATFYGGRALIGLASRADTANLASKTAAPPGYRTDAMSLVWGADRHGQMTEFSAIVFP